MSDKHHPSCTPNDKDLIWVCAQCGLKEPVPTTGKWTVRPIHKKDGTEWPGIGYISDGNRTYGSANFEEAKAIVAAINAALAAEREVHLCTENAERSRNNELREQLAAAEEHVRVKNNLERDQIREWNEQEAQWKQQLVVEREKAMQEMDALIAKLAAERETSASLKRELHAALGDLTTLTNDRK